MRIQSVSQAAALVLLLGFCVQTQAAPLVLKHVPANAKWLAHVDVDALRSSTVVQKMWKKTLETHKNAETHLGMVTTFLGMDPRSDLYGMTFFGNEIGKHTGTLIVHAKLDQKRLMGMAQAVPGQSTTKYGDYEVFSFVHKHHNHSQTVAGTFFKSDWLVLSSSVEELQAALDVLEGKSGSVPEGAALAGRVPPGTTVLFRIAGVAAADLPCKCAVAKKIDSFRFVTGEDNGQSFFRARTVTTDAEVANQLKAVVEGGRAVALLHCGEDQAGKKLVNPLTAKVEEKTLTVLWKAPANDVWDMIEKQVKILQEFHARHRAAHHRHGDGPKGPARKALPPDEDF